MRTEPLNPAADCAHRPVSVLVVSNGPATTASLFLKHHTLAQVGPALPASYPFTPQYTLSLCWARCVCLGSTCPL